MHQVKTRNLETGEIILAPEAANICDQVSRALQYLSSRNISHGNVAAANVLVVSPVETGVKVKLGDPVFAFTKWEDCIARTAPNLWNPLEPPPNTTLMAADVWAFGTFMWEVFSFNALS